MDWPTLSNIFIGIATLAMTTMTFRAVKESIRARRTTYVPHLSFENVVFKGSVQVSMSTAQANIVISDKSYSLNPGCSIAASLPLTNLGMGAAKEIRVEWVYQLPKHDDISPYMAFISEDSLSRNEGEQYFSFLEPGNKVNVYLPCRLFAYYLLCMEGHKSACKKAVLNLSYKDLENNLFALTYKICTSMEYLRPAFCNETWGFSGEYKISCAFTLIKNEMYKKKWWFSK